ncbi:transcriptional regulator [Actinoplanes sp. ATCC 53533]|uniref:helix-turn-helix domain-containing protein n=1 Tax=Actinoplanes sp. ATCC 53533 TaxID=1288362 RepID=UPI000F79E830|nr:helix-turn-helix transcriptional regulator [Actinoplanes sp. ATCC 53533]RSM73512.1 transcriptional regulator [Actinoplanes sp. ATCC 53533]
MPSDRHSAFAEELRRLRAQSGLSLRELGARVTHGKSYIQELEAGQKPPNLAIARRLDKALDGGGRLAATLRSAGPDDTESEIEALELAQRVAASDVSHDTLDRLERAVDTMAMAYARTPPADLLPRVRRHLDYMSSLVDARKTLAQHKRLLVVGGWLALLRATLHIDLRQANAADGYLRTARQLAEQSHHAEIAAWCLETRAWDVLTKGDYQQALELSQHAQDVAPEGSSAFIQATAQEGRAWARLGDRARTRDALGRVERLASPRPVPDHPEHHYRYDPAKAHSYAATTLAWARDPAAEGVARDVIAELETEGARPRRVASANLDLGLALLAADKPDEAAAAASQAIGSGRVVASNWWRASEVVANVEQSGIPEARDLRAEYEAFRPAEPS